MQIFGNIAVASFVIVIAGVSSAAAQSANGGALDKRMDLLEKKVDALIELLQSQQGANPAKPTAETASAEQPQSRSAPAGYVSGVYRDAWAPDPGSLIDRPYFDIDGIPSASEKLPASVPFEYAGVFDNQEMKSFLSAQDFGVRYAGTISIEKSGKHHFRVDVTMEVWNGGDQCRSSFSMNDTKIVSSLKVGRAPLHAVGDSGIDLEAGLYSYSFFTFCKSINADHPLDYRTVRTQLLVAEPGDRGPHAIPPDRFFIKADE